MRRSDGRLILRDTAQTAPEEGTTSPMSTGTRIFTATTSGSTCVPLRMLRERGAVLGLPLIRNSKTVDPTHPASPRVVQIETAMGAAIEVFEGAQAMRERSRFLPVKTTDDLLLLRSDVYAQGCGWDAEVCGRPGAAGETGPALLPDHGRLRGTVPGRAAVAARCHRARRSDGAVHRTFGDGVVVVGGVELADTGQAERVADGDAPRGGQRGV